MIVSNVNPVEGSRAMALPLRPPYPPLFVKIIDPATPGEIPAVLMTATPCPLMLTGLVPISAPAGLNKWRVPLTELSRLFCSIATVVWVPPLLKRETL